jgi:MFS-type transporter involved in bile tolerance (Atg22 family)
MGLVGVLTGNPRHSILAIAVLFLGGGIILYFVDEKEGMRIAREFEARGLTEKGEKTS